MKLRKWNWMARTFPRLLYGLSRIQMSAQEIVFSPRAQQSDWRPHMNKYVCNVGRDSLDIASSDRTQHKIELKVSSLPEMLCAQLVAIFNSSSWCFLAVTTFTVPSSLNHFISFLFLSRLIFLVGSLHSIVNMFMLLFLAHVWATAATLTELDSTSHSHAICHPFVLIDWTCGDMEVHRNSQCWFAFSLVIIQSSNNRLSFTSHHNWAMTTS